VQRAAHRRIGHKAKEYAEQAKAPNKQLQPIAQQGARPRQVVMPQKGQCAEYWYYRCKGHDEPVDTLPQFEISSKCKAPQLSPRGIKVHHAMNGVANAGD